MPTAKLKTIYRLKQNNRTILAIQTENDDWLPVPQKLNPDFVRRCVEQTLQENGAPTWTSTTVSGFGGPRSMHLSYESRKWRPQRASIPRSSD